MKPRLHLYNTATRAVEPFEPLHSPVGMYCCGPTVYNYAHIGNLRSYIFEDVLKRALTAFGFTVKHVVNITDVGHLTSDADSGDDKMEKGAAREGKSVWDIAKFYTDAFMRNIKDLNILPANVWPKATDHIADMIAMVSRIEQRGFTYKTGDGIYFDTTKFPEYANFARLDAESIMAGARVEMGDKRNPMDFALWKFSPKDAKRQMEWQSPWGMGFPGWHIECSAMSLKYLPQPLDIHCGGIDHVRVHHTNEIAQVEAATGKPFVKHWLHGEFLVMDTGKMAKSAGNFITLDTLVEQGINPVAYRLFCFSAHYRSPLTFSWDGIKAAAQSLKNLKKLAADATEACAPASVDEKMVDALLGGFWSAIAEDLNMPRAMAALYEVLRDQSAGKREKYVAVMQADAVLALDLFAPESEGFVREVTGADGRKIRIVAARQLANDRADEIVRKVRDRRAARAEKRFADADAVRNELKSANIEIKDLPDGTTECVVN